MSYLAHLTISFHLRVMSDYITYPHSIEDVTKGAVESSRVYYMVQIKQVFVDIALYFFITTSMFPLPSLPNTY